MTARAYRVGELVKEAMAEMELPSEMYLSTFEPQNAAGYAVVQLQPNYEFRIPYNTKLETMGADVRAALNRIFGKYKSPQDAARANGCHNMTNCWCNHTGDEHTGPLGEEGFRHRHCYECAEIDDGRECCALPKDQRPKDLEQ